MKFFVNLLLFTFITFLSTPTIVSIIEKSCDTSIFYTMTEEECHKEIKASTQSDALINRNHRKPLKSCLVLSENLSRHDNISAAIFIPPPDTI